MVGACYRRPPPYSVGAGTISSTFLQIHNEFYELANPVRCSPPPSPSPGASQIKRLWAIVSRHPCSLVLCGLYLLDTRALICFAGYIFVIPMLLDASDRLCCFALVPPVTSCWAVLGSLGRSCALFWLSWALLGSGGAGLSWDLLELSWAPSTVYFKKNGEGSLLQMLRYHFSKKWQRFCCFKLWRNSSYLKKGRGFPPFKLIIIPRNMGLSRNCHGQIRCI